MEGDLRGCRTPLRKECWPKTAIECPPPPKKKRVAGNKKDLPKYGYFEPPDLETVFRLIISKSDQVTLLET